MHVLSVSPASPPGKETVPLPLHRFFPNFLPPFAFSVEVVTQVRQGPMFAVPRHVTLPILPG